MACGAPADDGVSADDARGDLGLSRDITDTAVQLDLASKRATATIRVAPFSGRALAFEVGDLSVESVRVDGEAQKFTLADGKFRGKRLDLSVPPTRDERTIEITYTFRAQPDLHGFVEAKKTSFTWPAFCQNLFPCHSSPADGARFALEVSGVPAGNTLIAPRRLDADAPSYMLAFAYGDYTRHELGVTSAGTKTFVYTTPNTDSAGLRGSAHLTEAVEWLETHLGPYTFGDEVGSVAADWGPSGFGGMEHHPYWHIANASMGEVETHTHEAAHGWYGNGVRIACWEDFVLSEGTTTYLETIVTGSIAGNEAQLWSTLERSLRSPGSGDAVAWLTGDGCNRIDLVTHPLWSRAPYDKGAFFYRAVEQEIGRDALIDVLSAFYKENVGTAKRMSDMLDAIEARTGFDPRPLAKSWLQSTTIPR